MIPPKRRQTSRPAPAQQRDSRLLIMLSVRHADVVEHSRSSVGAASLRYVVSILELEREISDRSNLLGEPIMRTPPSPWMTTYVLHGITRDVERSIDGPTLFYVGMIITLPIDIYVLITGNISEFIALELIITIPSNIAILFFIIYGIMLLLAPRPIPKKAMLARCTAKRCTDKIWESVIVKDAYTKYKALDTYIECPMCGRRYYKEDNGVFRSTEPLIFIDSAKKPIIDEL
jgi:hypothetical protein